MARPTQERLHELFLYSPEDGRLYWRNDRGGVCKAGCVAGAPMQNGYRQVQIDHHNCLEHRVIWLYVHGEWPDGDIDHINGIRDDNRIANLRATTRHGNMLNAKKRRDNTSGYVGVTWDGWSGKWKAQVCFNGKNISLGRHERIEDAIAARAKASALYGFSNRHGE